MFGAIYIGLSGLSAYSRGLQQVSNNVSNLNTTGFKSSTVSFQNFYGSADQGGLSFSTGSGSSGGGVGVGDQRLDMKQGELRQSDRDLDLTVDGAGFLVLMKGDEMVYARTGSFEVDKDGFVVLSGTEYRLATLDPAGRPTALSITDRQTNPPAQTTKIKLGNYISSSATSYVINDVKVYDANGTQYLWKVQFDRASVQDTWKVKISDDKGLVSTAQELKYQFGGGPVDPTTSKLKFAGTGGFEVEIDFSATMTFTNQNSALSVTSVDGRGVGSLATLSVNAKGELELGYSNEQKVSLGAVAISDFRNPQELEQRSGGLFAYSGSDPLTFLSSSDTRVGQVLGKRLEASNVDLSKQFGDLILIQRGFQASSQIVSVSNDMIQQLFGIRGQG